MSRNGMRSTSRHSQIPRENGRLPQMAVAVPCGAGTGRSCSSSAPIRSTFAGNITDHQPEPLAAEIEEVIVIAADLASLDADTRVLERGQGRKRLREEP